MDKVTEEEIKRKSKEEGRQEEWERVLVVGMRLDVTTKKLVEAVRAGIYDSRSIVGDATLELMGILKEFKLEELKGHIKMNKVTEEDIKTVIEGIHDRFAAELMACEEKDLEQYWHFKHDPEIPLYQNIYKFYDRLSLYHGFCRRWEEAKNGHICVVERVRDKYLMPKIKEFITTMENMSGDTSNEQKE